ncbi:hypothetical protein [Actinomadura rugatobispora]|uniref:Uncharacterized protein n=1 Tax=Actinomadura rugatobispora TaxID=1994 RepID=A0ABW1AG56_9ACTN|nr:hypothetical protein GCM10010200_087170 [Actinomadura rugatobispora]
MRLMAADGARFWEVDAMSDESAQVPAPPGGPVPRLREPARPEPTGDVRVDEALARLAELDAAPVSGHVEIFEGIHQRLQELLASAGQDDPPEGGRPAVRPPVPGAASPAAGPRPGVSGPRPSWPGGGG